MMIYAEILRKRFEEEKTLINDTIRAAKDIPFIEEGDFYDFLSPGELRIDIPFDLKLYRKYRKNLGSCWKFSRRVETATTVTLVFTHKKFPAITLRIGLDPKMSGSTCKLIKTGEKIIPIFSVKCT